MAAADVGADPLGEGGEQAREQRVRGRVEPERRRAVGEEVEVLWATDGAAVDRLHVDETRLTEPLEVEPDRVRVQPEPVGEVLGRQCGSGARQLAVHREARLVAERLQYRELVGLPGHRP